MPASLLVFVQVVTLSAHPSIPGDAAAHDLSQAASLEHALEEEPNLHVTFNGHVTHIDLETAHSIHLHTEGTILSKPKKEHWLHMFKIQAYQEFKRGWKSGMEAPRPDYSRIHPVSLIPVVQQDIGSQVRHIGFLCGREWSQRYDELRHEKRIHLPWIHNYKKMRRAVWAQVWPQINEAYKTSRQASELVADTAERQIETNARSRARRMRTQGQHRGKHAWSEKLDPKDMAGEVFLYNPTAQ